MNTDSKRKDASARRCGGFTLIEVIGVLSIVAVLSALLVPRVLGAIEHAKVVQVTATMRGVRAAVLEYFQHHHRLPPPGRMEDDLIQGGFLDGPLEAAIGEEVSLFSVRSSSDGVFIVDGSEYDLDGDGRSGSSEGVETSGQVVSLQISGVGRSTAERLSDAIDGEDLGADDDYRFGGGDDRMDVYGKVIYDGRDDNFPTDVYIYLLHHE